MSVEIRECRLFEGNALEFYASWEPPDVIVSDGAYGVGGFEGDPSDPEDLAEWYEPHVRAWSSHAKDNTTLWFWNTELGWAVVHPVLRRYGWQYVHANVWDKGMGHVAGNINTKTLRHFPVVTELCAQYVREGHIGGVSMRTWLKTEWQRTGLPLRLANEACGVADAAVRKYFDQGQNWYWPPPQMFARIASYANEHGDPAGRPYYSLDQKTPATAEEWAQRRSRFACPHGVTNVWRRNTVRGSSRVTDGDGNAAHPNQKPCDLMLMLLEASSNKGDIVWEPFGGLFTASLAAGLLHRKAYAAEQSAAYFHQAVERLRGQLCRPMLPMVEDAL